MESSPLDYVAQACLDLTEAMVSANSEAERDALIISHIKKVWPVVPPIDDFKKSKFCLRLKRNFSLILIDHYYLMFIHYCRFRMGQR